MTIVINNYNISNQFPFTDSLWGTKSLYIPNLWVAITPRLQRRDMNLRGEGKLTEAPRTQSSAAFASALCPGQQPSYCGPAREGWRDVGCGLQALWRPTTSLPAWGHFNLSQIFRSPVSWGTRKWANAFKKLSPLSTATWWLSSFLTAHSLTTSPNMDRGRKEA